MLKPKIGFKRIACECFATNNSTGIGTIRNYAKWDGKEKRCPKKGEYFISGAVPVAYLAKADMATEYFIAVLCD